MADETLENEPEYQAEAAKPSGRGAFRLVKAVAFVSVVVVVELVVASMITPSAQETAKLAHELAAASAGKAADDREEHAEDHAHGDTHDLREVELGTYNVTRFNPTTNTTLAIDFELFGTVLADDATDFEHHFENSKARIREQVTMTLHGADSASLSDAGLGLIKRQILEKTNRALGEPLVKEVLFSKFNFVER
ncbi:MAG: flagellar basal body-associated FliL family protein [Planctomycetes bacterium]|nr:flagellar basal body-associated FliL family protein [Planctomycetota bacterium]